MLLSAGPTQRPFGLLVAPHTSRTEGKSVMSRCLYERVKHHIAFSSLLFDVSNFLEKVATSQQR